MNNVIGLGVFALGIMLLIFGFSESQSFSSELSRAFTGNPSDRSVWLIVGGVLAVVVGLFLTIRETRKT